jgi:carbon-monoxide dehydrogenase large subunit
MRHGLLPPVPRDVSERPGAGGPSSETKFGIGQPVHRREDPTLVTGKGRYTDDVQVEGQAYAAFVRSPFAHGTISSVDLETAREMPGVIAVYGPQDLAHYGDFPNVTAFKNRDGSAMLKPKRKPLALDKVRYVGDPVAFVVAETLVEAREAAEAVLIEVDQLPAAATAAEAAAKGAPELYDDIPGNLFLDFQYGDEAKVEAGFAKAAHVTRLTIASHRLVINPMEPRTAIGEWDPGEGKYTLTAGTQGVFGMRNMVSGVMGVDKDKVRIVTGNVGGSFGMKIAPFPEYVGVLHAARDLGRPVKWTDMRSESFVADFHGRGIEVDAELALDAEGRFLALRMKGLADLGAYLAPVAPLFATINLPKNAVGVYKTPAISAEMKCYLTNAAPIGAYRGAGRPEGNYIMERLIEQAAREMKMDPLAMRRLNHIAADQIPYATPVETTYDSGEYSALFERALKAADWNGFEARKAESAKRGKLRGRGIGQYLEVTAPPQNEMGGIRFEEDGTVTILTGTLDYGQGHWTPFAQVLSTHLGVPFEKIRLLQGDSDQLIAGGGTGGSKSIMASGAAIIEASQKVIGIGRTIAAELLEAGVADIEFEDGRFTIAGTDRGIGIMEMAAKLREGVQLPDGVPRSLDVKHVHELSPSAYPNGCHVAEVEVDPEIGTVQVVRYAMVNDFGVVVNPMLVEGQLHGGVVQGIGQAIMERTAYDSEGQLVSGSFMDYALPRAEDAPPFVFESRPVPATTNLLGAKGCGEAGCAGALPSVMNALIDALGEVGVTTFDMPATPNRVWKAIQEARAGA